MIFLTLLLIPTIVSFIAFLIFEHKITLKKFTLQMGIQIVIIGGLTAILRYANTSDTEIQNGVVSSKNHERVSCEHSYPCHCHQVCSGSGKNESCYEHCDTCYDHPYDIDWNVFTTNREDLKIDRLAPQGLQEPPRWTAVKIGEPTSKSYTFMNYIKAAPGTLFRHQGLVEKYAGHLPNYPLDIYDYYRNNHTVTVDYSPANLASWNFELARINGDLGVQKQVNAIVVLTKHPQEYFEALNQHWLGGKKNDVVVVIGVDDSSATATAKWVQVMSWSDREILKVVLRDHLVTQTLDPVIVSNIIEGDIRQLYVRRHWKDFEYLMSSATPTKGQWIFALIFGLLISIGLSWFLEENDVFDEDRHYY